MDKLRLAPPAPSFVKTFSGYSKELAMAKTILEPRHIEFIGDQKNDSIVIGNYGDARITAIGTFELAGLIHCRQSTVEINVSGEGTIQFKGICKKLIIQGVEGNCTLDLSNVTCQSIRCEGVSGTSVVILGRTRLIELISLDQEAVVKYDGHPIIMKHLLQGNSRIENLKRVA